MKPHCLRAVFFCALIQKSALCGDILPSWRFENRSATDGSIVQCLVADLTPGIEHEFEVSEDLVTWETRTTVYGVGQSFAFPLRTFTPAPPPDPELPSPISPAILIRNVSLVLAPSSSGGTLISWASLETGIPIIVRLDTSMDPAWSSIPVYWQTFGNFGIFVVHPPVTLPEPAENPILTGADADLIATLEEHFDEMNTEVANSAAASRNTPPPAASPSGNRLFARIRARQVDSDSDGVTDDAEFKLLLAPGGHPLANPFLADVNGDGIPDGQQLDSDSDGTPDMHDTSPDSSSDASEILPVPRYAMFTQQGGGVPLQISDKGTVLLNTGTWSAGNFRSLALLPHELLAINDNDIIIGTKSKIFTPAGQPPVHQTILVAATGHGQPLVEIADSAGNNAGYSVLEGYPGRLSNSNVISGHTVFPNGGGDASPNSPNAWIVNPAGHSSRISRDLSIVAALDNNIGWRAGSVLVGSDTFTLGSEVTNIIRDGKDSSILHAITYDGVWTRYGPGWARNAKYNHAFDIAADGTAIGSTHVDLTEIPSVKKIHPIQINKRWTPLDAAVPGLPARWLDDTSSIFDISPSGWILARRGEGTYDDNGVPLPTYPEMETGVLLPLRLTGVAPNPGFPEVTGVDDFSVKSFAPGDAVGDKLWIMAPIDQGETTVTLQTPLPVQNPRTTLRLFNSYLNFDGNGGYKNITERTTRFTVQGNFSTPSGDERPLDISLGGAASLSDPISVKFMKTRTVRVTVHKVTKRTPGKPDNPPDFTPVDSTLRNYLNSALKPQINTSFAVSYGKEIIVDWDINGNGSLNQSGEDVSGEQGIIFDDLAADPPDTTNPHIRVFLIGSEELLNKSILDPEKGAYGITSRSAASCWVLADPVGGRTGNKLYRTITHEIGHILIGAGHPDERGGRASLPGTRHAERLMASGDVLASGHRLVKAEWDAAEAWMVNVEKDNPMN